MISTCLKTIVLGFRRPIEERVVHALGKAWHVEVSFYGSLYNETNVCSDLIFVIIHILKLD